MRAGTAEDGLRVTDGGEPERGMQFRDQATFLTE